MYEAIGGYVMDLGDLIGKCCEALNEHFNYPCNDVTENETEGSYSNINERKNRYIECILEVDSFQT